MWRGFAILLLLASCERVFGISSFSAHDAAPDTDAATSTAGTFVRQVVSNDSGFHPTLVPSPLTSADATLAARTTPGQAPTPIALSDSGAFSYQGPLPLALQITIPGQPPTELQTSARTLALADTWIGRADRVPAPMPTTITYTGVPASTTVLVQGTGAVWASASTTGTLDWSQAIPTQGAVGLLDATRHDLLYAFHFVQAMDGANQPYIAIDAGQADMVTMSGGAGTPTIAYAPTTLPRSLCAHIVASEQTELARIIAADPALTALDANWKISALPPGAPYLAGLVGLASRGTGTPIDDDAPGLTFLNPFASGYTLVGSMAVDAVRTIQLAGTTTGITAYAGTQIAQELLNPTACAPATTTDLGQELAMPDLPTLDGVALDHDQDVTIDRAKDAVVQLSTSSTGRVDYYDVSLVEAYASAGATETALVQRYRTTDTTLTLDPALLVANHTYFLVVETILGYPNVRGGDWQTQSLPRGFALIPSYLFHVAN